MKLKKCLLIGMALIASSSLSYADTDSENVHWGHEYDPSDWQRNFTLSFGADALRSNASVHSDQNTVTLNSDSRWGYGIFGSVELGLADFAGVAIGVHYLDRRFAMSDGPVQWTRNINTVFVPVEGRFYLLKVISISAGGFAAMPVGKTHDTFSNGNSTLVETGDSRNGLDLGLTGALGINIPLGPLGVFGEARYNYGLTDSSSNKDVEEKMRDFMVSVGVKFKI